MRKWLLVGIIAIAFLLRVIGLSNYPVGFTADEASFGYDAYSILKTGKDVWGQTFPLAFRSFGDFKLPAYTYLTLPSVAIFGLNEFAVRLPSAVMGTLAVLATYLMVSVLFNKKKNESPVTNHQSLAMLSALLLAISPWHISLSRGAFEANLTTFFMPLGVWMFLKSIKRPKLMVLTAVIFGLNLFTYHSARLVTPLLVLLLVWLERNSVEKKKLYLASFVFLLFFSLSVFQLVGGGGSRVSDVIIFNPTDNWRAVSERRYEAVLAGLPDSISRAFSNKVTYTLRLFVHNLLTYMSPAFLFLRGAGEATYGMISGMGVLYLTEIVFIIAALISFVRKPNEKIRFFLIWILIGFFPASVSKGSGYAANRAAVVMPAFQVISAYGIVILFEWFKKSRINFLPRKVFWGTIVVLLFISLASFLENYIYHSPATSAPAMSYGWRETINFVKGIEDNYNEIVVSRAFSESQIFVAFYSQMDPRIVQKNSEDWLRYEKMGLPFIDQLGEYHLGKYTFRDINFSVDQNLPRTLIIGVLREFPEDITPLKTVYYPSGKEAVLIVDPASQIYAKANY